jgi:uncharacterized protein YdeI (YjbR/CyaY-like superfamily)
MTKPQFFRSQEAWRAWLEKNHAKVDEKWVGFHKVASGKKGITHAQALDEALCFGWIDGRAAGGDTSYAIRFSRRRKGSNWSDINIKRIAELKAAGKVAPAGLAAFAARDPNQPKLYSSENRHVKLAPAFVRKFRADEVAWKNFSAMPLSYRHPATFWVMSAKQEATRERRLAMLITDSRAGRRVKPLRPPEKK